MKPVLLFTVLVLLALYASSMRSVDTDIDDELLQQILNDPQLSDLLKDPDKLMDMLREKLHSSSESGSKCSVAINKRRTIIKTRESQEAGAIFLSAFNVDSSQACVDACCANLSCSTAVMKQKVW